MSKITIRLYIIIIMTVLVLTLILPLLNNSYAVSKLKPGETTKDISRVDKTKYPGIVERINILKKKYPNWEFEFYKTGLDWDTFIQLEYAPNRTGSGLNPFNLVTINKKGEWVCDYRGTNTFDTGIWVSASYHAIEYMADPRTYLNEYDIFSLYRVADKSNSLSKAKSIEIIEGALKGKSYLKYKEDIYNVSKEENVDFVDVVSRLIQEQGNGTVLSDGNKASDGKIYYNPFNVAASGNGAENIIRNATEHARVKGWDTFAKGLRGGIQLVKTNYKKQNTSYFEKFNATESNYSGISNQYMQNIEAPTSEGSFKKGLLQKVDSSLTNGVYTFVIPLYENMQKVATTPPNSNATTPDKSGQIKLEPKLPANALVTDRDGLNLRKSPASSGGYISTHKAGTDIKVLKKEANYWYQVEIVSSGAKGYMSRRVGSEPDYFVFYPEPTMKNKTVDYIEATNQDNPNLPLRAKLTDAIYVRSGPSLSSSSLGLLSNGSLIQVNKRHADKDGYMWYHISYNLKADGSGFSNTGYMARERVGQKNYWFVFIEPIDFSESENPAVPPAQTGDGEKLLSNQVNPNLPSYAVLNEDIRLRRGEGSLSATTIRVLPKGTRIRVRTKRANKDGYEWYQIYYNWNGKGFNNSGYIARNLVGSKNYYFTFIQNPNWSECEFLKSLSDSVPVTPPANVESFISNQKNPSLPAYAVLEKALTLKRASGSLSSTTIRVLPKGTRIRVVRKVANRDGYEWYMIYYNWNGKSFDNSGYIARNKVSSTSYGFKFITNPDWTKCEFLASLKSIPEKPKATTYPRTARTSTLLNVRRGSGSLSSPIIRAIPAKTQISIRKRVADKDGYTWYLIYYNLVNGRYQNSGFVSRNAIRSTNYYFNYI